MTLEKNNPIDKALQLNREDGQVVAALLGLFTMHDGKSSHMVMGSHDVHCQLPQIFQENIVKFGLFSKFREEFYSEIESYFKQRRFDSLQTLHISRNEKGPYFKVKPGDCACLGNDGGLSGYSPHNIDDFDQRDALFNALRIFLKVAYQYFEFIIDEGIKLDEQLPETKIINLNNLNKCLVEQECQNEDTHTFDCPCGKCLRKISNQLSILLSPANLKDNFKPKK